MTLLQTSTALIQELSTVGHTAVERGLVLASGGNLSARLPDGKHFVVTGSGTWLDTLSEDDFTVMSLEGEVVGGNPRPSSEWKLHQRSYQVRPDVNSVIHMHPQYAVLMDAVDKPIRLITLDHAYYVKSIGVAPYHPNGSDELADLSAAQLEDHNCVIMQHHGCTTVADSISMAYRRMLNLEEAATATYRALLLGDTTATFPVDAFDSLHHA